MTKPHTDKKAKPKHYAQTYGKSELIDVINANVRCSTVSGTFQIAPNKTFVTYRGQRLIEVICTWYDWKPKRRYILLILNNNEKSYQCTKDGTYFVTNIER